MTSPALPPGQIETERFPVVGERSPSRDLSDPSDWRVEVAGSVARPLTIDLAAFLARADQTLTFDIHCVTGWTRLGSTFTGMPLSRLLEEAGPLDEARFVSFDSYSQRDHHTSLPLSLADEDCWLVHSFEGEPLGVEHGGPVRLVTPSRYFYKSIKWVKRVMLLAEDRLGWWEQDSSYHNNADPWSGSERFSTGSVRPDQLRRFMEAPNYDKYRGRVLIGVDLRDWQPATTNLRGLHLKSCDLRGVSLTGADLHGSNLSLSDLRGADLSGADLSGSDLEGVDFTGADLTAADLSHTALTATRFGGSGKPARLKGASFEGSWGLTESQEVFVPR